MPEWLVDLYVPQKSDWQQPDPEETDRRLRELSSVFTGEECRINYEADKFLLSSTRFAGLTLPDDVWHDAAGPLVDCINAVEMLGMLAGDHLPRIRRGRAWLRSEAGDLVRQSVSPRVGSISFTWSDGSERPLLEPSATSALVRLQDANPDVRDALDLWGTCPHDFSTLYKIFEVIEHSAGKRQAMVRRGYATYGELQRFLCVNEPLLVDIRSARHARSKENRSPKAIARLRGIRPMAHSSAEEFIRAMVVRWLLSLCLQADEPGREDAPDREPPG